jgi:hypothetical protein
MAVHVLIRGRIGDGWYDVDRTVKLAPGTTLAQLIADGERLGLPLATAVADSPHLAHTLMWNGERCPWTSTERGSWPMGTSCICWRRWRVARPAAAKLVAPGVAMACMTHP